MQPTLETEIVKAHTRLDGVDARLKKIERKLDRVVWYAGIVCGVAGVVMSRVMSWLGV